MVMAERLKFAPGFRFCPTDQELITEYLKPKVLGDTLRYNFIETVDLYGPKSTPWQLFDVNDDKSWTDSPQVQLKEKYLYVFTNLSKLRCSETSKGSIRENMRKKAGCGTWVGRTKRKPIKEKGMLIGEQRMLVFEINDGGDQFDIGHFRMHEYSLSGVNKGLKSASGDNMVVCKITFSSSKKPVFKLNSKSTKHGPTKRGTKRGKGQDVQQNKNEEILERSNEEILERSGGDNLEGNMNSTSTIEGSECLTAENLFVMMDSGVGDSKDYLTDFDDGSLEFGWDASFTDEFMGLMNSEEGAVEDISQLGKRKIEEENFCRSKKMCF